MFHLFVHVSESASVDIATNSTARVQTWQFKHRRWLACTDAGYEHIVRASNESRLV
jgi:hypothetical protein